MDYYSIFYEAVRPLWWLLLVALAVGILKSRWFKGLFGEAFVKLIAKVRLPAEEYRGIHNVTLATPDGTTQIDHVLISRYGIFVIETKHMTGWIFGSERQAQWTQKIYRKTFKFQNPLRQNFRHVKALEALLDVPLEAIHSVVVFSGSAVFKTRMPANITIGGGYVRYIKSFREPVLNDFQVQEALERIETGWLAPNRETHRQHVKQLKARFESSSDRACPKCGSSMVLRTSKRGANVATGSGDVRYIPSAGRCRILHSAGYQAREYQCGPASYDSFPQDAAARADDPFS